VKTAGYSVVEVWFFVVRVWSEAALYLRGSDYATSSLNFNARFMV
jgi:hypothetical protein